MIFFSLNNRAGLSDLEFLSQLGIRELPRSPEPMKVSRDPGTGKLMAEIGEVTVWRDGLIRFRARHDTPDGAKVILARTAVECLERDLHKRDHWEYARATKNLPGSWSSIILVGIRDGGSLFEAHAEALRPAAQHQTRHTARVRHPLSA